MKRFHKDRDLAVSETQWAVVCRLAEGNGLIVPRAGGYWLPGECAGHWTENQWFERSGIEFNARVGTQTVQALALRHALKPVGPSPYDTRRKNALLVHELVRYPCVCGCRRILPVHTGDGQDCYACHDTCASDEL